MRLKKKIICILMSVLMLLPLAACSDNSVTVAKYKDTSIDSSMFSYMLSSQKAYLEQMLYYYYQTTDFDSVWASEFSKDESGNTITFGDNAFNGIVDALKMFVVVKQLCKEYGLNVTDESTVNAIEGYISEDIELKNIFSEAKKCGNEDIVYMFGSTSKITFPGSGVAWICASEKNIYDIKKYLSIQTIGFDKINQLAHVKLFKDIDGLKEQMKKHALILKPKFDAVIEIFRKELSGLCKWSEPKGGYFISCDLPDGTAKRAVQLAKEAGVIMTAAGATFPYKNDPCDKNVRIAPSYPSLEELRVGMEVFCCCVKLAWAEKVLNA